MKRIGNKEVFILRENGSKFKINSGTQYSHKYYVPELILTKYIIETIHPDFPILR